MALITAKEGGVDLDPGAYIVTCVRAEDTKGEYGQQVKLELEIEDMLDEDGEPIRLPVWASAKLTPSSKLWSWVEAFGFKIELGEAFDTEEFEGAKAQAVVVRRPNNKGIVTSKIDTIIPISKRAARRAEPEPTGDPSEMPLSEWWATTRARKWERKDVLALAQEMFGDEPANLSGADRAVLLESIIESDDLPFE